MTFMLQHGVKSNTEPAIQVCVGSKKEYVLVDPIFGAITPVHVPLEVINMMPLSQHCEHHFHLRCANRAHYPWHFRYREQICSWGWSTISAYSSIKRWKVMFHYVFFVSRCCNSGVITVVLVQWCYSGGRGVLQCLICIKIRFAPGNSQWSRHLHQSRGDPSCLQIVTKGRTEIPPWHSCNRTVTTLWQHCNTTWAPPWHFCNTIVTLL
jgi:hypothetical protein